MYIPNTIIIKEVGPRDGLQNESSFVDTSVKVDWINSLSQTGLSYIEITSFVHPNWIPQLRDALEVARLVERKEGVTYAALVPNLKGLENALEADVDEVSVFMSASESHNQKNINKSIDETFPVLEEVIKVAMQSGKKVRGYVSTVFGCPYEGNVSLAQVSKVVDRLFTMGVYEVSLGDTIGIAHPKQMDEFLMQMVKDFPVEQLALHLHDTRGMALANALVGLSKGITVFDSSVGGLGGCPYAKGASGNVATEDLIYMVEQMGVETGVQLPSLIEAAKKIESILNKPLSSKLLKLYPDVTVRNTST